MSKAKWFAFDGKRLLGMNKDFKTMARKQAETTTIDTTTKRTRTVVKWQDSHEKVTCATFGLFMDNKDNEKLPMVARKLQNVFESISQMVKDGKASKEMRERRDNLELALQVAGITNSNVVEMLDNLISLFK